MNSDLDLSETSGKIVQSVFGEKGILEVIFKDKNVLDKSKTIELETTSPAGLAFKKVILLLECLMDESLRSQLAVLQKQTGLLIGERMVVSTGQEFCRHFIDASLEFERRVYQILVNSTELFVNHILYPYTEECERVRGCLQALSLYITRVFDFRDMPHLRSLTQLKIKFDQTLQNKILPLVHQRVISLFPQNTNGELGLPTGLEPPIEVVSMFPVGMKPLSRFFVSGLNSSHISGACRLVLTRDNQLKVGFYFYAVFTNNSIWFFSFPFSRLNAFQDFLYWKGTWHVHKIFPHIPLRNPHLVQPSHQCYATLLQWKHVESILRCSEHKDFFSVAIKTTFPDRQRPGKKVCFKLVGPNDKFWVNRIFRHVDKVVNETNTDTKTVGHHKSQNENSADSASTLSSNNTEVSSLRPPFPSSLPPPLPRQPPVLTSNTRKEQ